MQKIKYLIIAIVGAYIIYVVGTIVFFSHKADWDKPKEYTWIFNDSIRNNLNRNLQSYSYFTSWDIYNNYRYQDTINIIVWEFNNFKEIKLNDIKFYQNINSSNIKFRSGQTINKDTDLEITMKYGFSFKNALNVDLNNDSEILKEIKTENYKGFLGTISKMSFSNERNKHQIFFNYTEGSQSSLLIFYKKESSLYLIIINSFSQLDENIINILNLQ